MASGPITSWQIKGEKVEVVTHILFLGSKITQMVTAAMKSEDGCFVAGNLHRELKSRDKDPYSQGSGLPSSHV